jgi:antitoxin component YwqK of YwqJK toxin-antitoxin module
MSPLKREMFYPSGKPMSKAEPSGPGHSLVREWTESGTLIFEYTVNAGREYDGPFRSWWDDGVPKEEETFRAGKRVGIYRWFLPSGKLWREQDCK